MAKKKKRKNKIASFSRKTLGRKGEISFLAEHALGIIISVLCILVLIVIAVVVYNLFSQQSDLDKAESNFKLVQGEIDMIKTSGGTNPGQIIVYFPKTWVLRSYTTDFPQTECYGKKSCLCICQAATCEGVQKYCDGFDYMVEINANYVDSGYFSSDSYPNAISFVQAAEGLNISNQIDKVIIEQAQNNKVQ